MRMDVETFAYDVLEGLNDGEVCFIISPTYKEAQLKAIKHISTIPFRVIEMGKDGVDGYMLDPSKCGVKREDELVHKGSYPECKRFVDRSFFSEVEKVVLMEPQYDHFCFEEYPNETV